MRSRQSILEIFSTFVQFDADSFSTWVSDAKLRRSMKNCLEQLELTRKSEDFWALYWHKTWQAEISDALSEQPRAQAADLAKAHLSAYLQETCYWAARKIATNLSSNQYALSDCFQIAIGKIDKVLEGVNLSQGATLKNYASAVFGSAIRELLRQRQEVDICTDWALLRKLSKKKLVESLQNAGLAPSLVAYHLLAWSCFNAVYAPTRTNATRKLTRPDDSVWEAIAALYREQRHEQLPSSEPLPTAQTLEQWLKACARAARQYMSPEVSALNAPNSLNSGELLDNLPNDPAVISGLDAQIAEEEEQHRQAQRADMTGVLIEAMGRLEPQAQRLLQLYYSQEFTQQQIAAQLDVKQYTISRQLTKHRQFLLDTLVQWSQGALHTPLTSDLIKDVGVALEEWLKVYYRQPALQTPREDLT
ncbi:sigma-70 family RNA polymerase sigma factor [Leptolyngbya sp. FACHB-261]|uniref:sigma-70 family RNA polymerase sigma factor n=1 Tax=Leptolyngbya sp. FACHB-261 TaxID=2692806 RepID=UPI0016881E23|nr:sigma-70 family RNA polymerase sigma factor [Leptolyngbya sp. FACHB-261]MBD2101055.1 sigma-70 family RNA polymerase sigma factor [Leptolyngbya sp. FACHB-261]